MSSPAAARLRRVVADSVPQLLTLDESAAHERPAPDKWSPSEILGHLVDSAANNHRRFVEAQLREDLVFPGYDQEAWVRVQAHARRPWRELLELWRAYNLHLAHVMDAAPEPERLRPRARHNLAEIGWRASAVEPGSLERLMGDYVDHLEHHLRQILGPLPVPAEAPADANRRGDEGSAAESAAAPRIRPFAHEDLPALRELVAEMQDAEREIDSRLLPGASMTAAYTEAMLHRCEAHGGAVLVAECAGEVVGFVGLAAAVREQELDQPPGAYALVTDLAVSVHQRGRGIGGALLTAAEGLARAHGARELRIALLSGNAPAARLYRAAGFAPYLDIMRKDLGSPP